MEGVGIPTAEPVTPASTRVRAWVRVCGYGRVPPGLQTHSLGGGEERARAGGGPSLSVSFQTRPLVAHAPFSSAKHSPSWDAPLALESESLCWRAKAGPRHAWRMREEDRGELSSRAQ